MESSSRSIKDRPTMGSDEERVMLKRQIRLEEVKVDLRASILHISYNRDTG